RSHSITPVSYPAVTAARPFPPHWVLRILEKRGPKPGPGTADDAIAVRNNTYQMLTLLAEERAGAGAGAGPILQLVLAENLLERLLHWHLQRDSGEEQRAEQLKLYEMLISQSHQPLLRHPPVRRPLLRLLSLCAEPASPALQTSLVLLLNQLCGCVAKEPALLELFFHRPTEQGPGDLLLFSLLVPFIHHEGPTGQQARDALLLLLAMAASNHAVATYITGSSYFCPVRSHTALRPGCSPAGSTGGPSRPEPAGQAGPRGSSRPVPPEPAPGAPPGQSQRDGPAPGAPPDQCHRSQPQGLLPAGASGTGACARCG
uniref:Family with sequence similarity 160 member A2 n=1 Tax=Terrapene triunguis TaxID=2587831 RepID=A0A674K3F9_9SAUR